MGNRRMWSTARLATSLIVCAMAVYYVVMAVKGLVTLPLQIASVSVEQQQAALSQTAALPTSGDGLDGRSLAFPLMIAAELLSGLLLLAGGALGLRSRGGTSWRNGRWYILSGCTLVLAVLWSGSALLGSDGSDLYLEGGLDRVFQSGLLLAMIAGIALLAPIGRPRIGRSDDLVAGP